MFALARRIAGHPFFDELVLGVIVLSSLAMGIEATPELAESNQGLLDAIFVATQIFFVAEIAVRLLAHWPRPAAFFADGWNVFDFVIVVLSLVPAVGGFALVARLLRALRVLRVISTRDALRGFVAGRRRGLAALPAIVTLGLVLAYLFALSGFYLFGEALPAAWGSLGLSFGSLGRLAGFRGVAPLVELSPFSWIYVGLFFAALASIVFATGRALAGSGKGPAEAPSS